MEAKRPQSSKWEEGKRPWRQLASQPKPIIAVLVYYSHKSPYFLLYLKFIIWNI
jgi:hypothetical protein